MFSTASIQTAAMPFITTDVAYLAAGLALAGLIVLVVTLAAMRSARQAQSARDARTHGRGHALARTQSDAAEAPSPLGRPRIFEM
jgi:hypothetical protein